MIIGADGPRSRVRETAMESAEKAAVTKFLIFHTNMTVCYGDADKARFVRQKFPTSYLALSQRSFHAFQSSQYAAQNPPTLCLLHLPCSYLQMCPAHVFSCTPYTLTLDQPSVSSMPDGPDHPESWIFHMAMAWLGESDNSMGYPERLALVKARAKGLGEPAHSAFMWLPDDTEVHKADISYWISQPWNNRQGRLTLVGDAAHPMPPCELSSDFLRAVPAHANGMVFTRSRARPQSLHLRRIAHSERLTRCPRRPHFCCRGCGYIRGGDDSSRKGRGQLLS